MNVVVDRKSRMFQDETEWQLNKKEFNKICSYFGPPEVDLFASRLNAQLSKFLSWYLDPDAEAVDAFTADWRTVHFHAFPPFCVIATCLQKIIFDKAEGLMVFQLNHGLQDCEK